MPDLIGDDEALRALDWERRLNVMEIRMRQAEARAEAWETRCLDAEAAAARLERQNVELAREAIGMKAAWLDLKTRDQKDFITIANERDALRPIVEAALLFRDARLAMQSQGWVAHTQEAEALEALFKSIAAFARQKQPA